MLNINEIKELIQLIDQSSIDEFTYESAGATVSLKKNNHSNNTVASLPVSYEQQAEIASKATKPVVEEEQPVKAEEAEAVGSEVAYDYEIVSPMVGTFYSKPSPESDVYVTVGSKVNADTVVCIVEAMKLFNEIEAEAAGEIVEVLVQDGELVEYGQPLFRVKK